MNPLPAIVALLKAITAALGAFPLWLAWRINNEIETINSEIIAHEAANTPRNARLADELRLKRAYRLRLHDALLSANPTAGKGDSHTDIGRAVPVAE
jgi:hypothetical protein